MAVDPARAFGYFSLSVDFCCGLFSVTERLKRALPDEGEGFVPEPGLLWLSLKAPPPVPATFFWKEKPVLSYRGGGKRFDINEDEAVVLESPMDLFALNNTLAEKDRSLYEADPFLNVLPEGVHFRGNRKDLLIHKTARILPQIAVSTENGPVVIDQEAVIAPFSVLEGPLYVGKGALIDGAKVTGALISGSNAVSAERWKPLSFILSPISIMKALSVTASSGAGSIWGLSPREATSKTTTLPCVSRILRASSWPHPISSWVLWWGTT